MNRACALFALGSSKMDDFSSLSIFICINTPECFLVSLVFWEFRLQPSFTIISLEKPKHLKVKTPAESLAFREWFPCLSKHRRCEVLPCLKENPKFLESWKCRNWRNPPIASWWEYPGWFFLNPKSSGPRRGAPRVISTWFHEYWWFMVYTLGISFWPILAYVAFSEKQDLCMPHCGAILCCGNCLGQDGGGVKCMGRRSDDHGGGMWKSLTGNDLFWNSQHAFKLDTA